MELFRWKSKSEILFLPGTERKLHLFYFSAFPEYTHTHTYFVFYLIEIKAYFTRLSPPLHSSNKPNVTFLTHPPYIVKHKKLILCFFVSVLLPDSPPLHTISCHTYIHAYRSLLLQCFPHFPSASQPFCPFPCSWLRFRPAFVQLVMET